LAQPGQPKHLFRTNAYRLWKDSQSLSKLIFEASEDLTSVGRGSVVIIEGKATDNSLINTGWQLREALTEDLVQLVDQLLRDEVEEVRWQVYHAGIRTTYL
jgi:hypothetical protein